MDSNSLKNSGAKERIYETNLRFAYLDAVESATSQMIRELREYILAHGTGPKTIVLKSHWYQSSPCVQGLTNEIKKLGLDSKILDSDSENVGDLNFDLDLLADGCFLDRSNHAV